MAEKGRNEHRRLIMKLHQIMDESRKLLREIMAHPAPEGTS